MTEGYLQVMIECLQKKNDILDQVLELDRKQAALSIDPSMNMEEYDETMDQKGKLIEQLEKLDDGFVTTYELVKDEVISNKEQYKGQIQQLQELIRSATDKGVAVEAQEKRNKAALDVVFRTKRQQLKQVKVSNSAALKYYKAMSRINNVDPQLMDRKK